MLQGMACEILINGGTIWGRAGPLAGGASARRIERVLWDNPGSGVMRHADAGYEGAIACAREYRVKLPSIG